MPSNPKSSPWYSTPQEKRKRKQVVVMLSDNARKKLDALIEARGGGLIRSQVIEDLIMAAKL